MMQQHHQNHATWECKYHVVFIPKYRKKGIHPVGAAGMALSELTAPSRQAARASGIGLRQFHGSSAARSVILWSAILASTSASQAWGSTSLSLAV